MIDFIKKYWVFTLCIFAILSYFTAMYYCEHKYETLKCDFTADVCQIIKTNKVGGTKTENFLKPSEIKFVKLKTKHRKRSRRSLAFDWYYLNAVKTNGEVVRIFSYEYIDKNDVNADLKTLKDAFEKRKGVVEVSRF